VHRPAEQLVANRAADQIDFHRIMVRDSPSRPARLLVAAAACVALPGCYYVQLAAGQMEMNRRREPIEEVLARPGTDETLKRRLELAARARDFAMEELGLPDNGSYRTYADLGRRYVTWNLFAAPELSVRPKRWCFPVAGCVAYRGYFKEASAHKAGAKLARKGFDVYVGPSIAYSTLGHLRDPVLNTMFGYGDTGLAAFIIHELAHQAVYARDDSDFNESFATVVEVEGLGRFLASEGRSAELEAFLAARRRERAAAELMVGTRRRLAALYAGPLDAAAKRERKAEELARLRRALADGGHAAGGVFNNARLVAVATYERCVAPLRAEFERLGNDLPAFYAAMKAIEDDPAARARLCPPG
jgi:predicted aminopeptidase